MKHVILLGLQSTANLGDSLVYTCTRKTIEGLMAKHGMRGYDIEAYDMLGREYYAYLGKKKKKDAEAAIRFPLEAEYRLKLEEEKARFIREYDRAHKDAPGNSGEEAPPEPKILSEEERQTIIDNEVRIKNKQYKKKSESARQKTLLSSAAAEAEAVINKDIAAVIIYGGGIIKYGHPLMLGYCMEAYIRRADKLGIPVMISTVGVDGYDAEDEECRVFSRILNLPCVKSITVRDDIELLTRAYVSSDDVRVRKVPCLTLLSRDLLPMGTLKEGRTVGLGVIKPDKMCEMHSEFTEEKQIALWQEIVAEVEKRGWRWKFFSNGMSTEYAFATKIVGSMGLTVSDDTLLPRPQNVHQLLDSYLLFDGVIASRFHVAVPSYSYGLPFVELVWNIKQTHFAKDMRLEDSFFDPEKATAAEIVDRLFDNMSTPRPEMPVNPQDAVDELERFLLTYCEIEDKED